MKQELPSYRNLYTGIVNGLEQIFFQDKYADKAIEKILRQNSKWGSRDRAFVAETLYDLVRWKRKVEAGMNQKVSPDNLWKFLGTWFVLEGKELPALRDFKIINQEKVLSNQAKTFHQTPIFESIPDWLYDLGIEELGKERWEKELSALNQKAKTIIRVNTLKTDLKTLAKNLRTNHQIETDIHPQHSEALILKQRENLFRTNEFQSGWFELQDASSQLVANYLEVKPGMRVIDACAGAGGKTLHIASLMENKGQIIALDIYEWKLKELKRRAKRNGVQNIQTKFIESAKTVKRLKNSADRVLIDAPCSGLGVLRRNPDAKWKLSLEFLNQVRKEQKEILQQYAQMVKNNGFLVYATCSILPSENEKQVDSFLAQNTHFKKIKQQTIYPSESKFDGFFMALMQKIT